MISVIVPVYKVERYLHRCIDSIINQTYKDLEIILIDDGSPDRCGVICDEYSKKDSRIKVIHQTNKGLSSARNRGLDIVSGDYIAFVDSDDYLDNDMYETLLEVAESENADVVECGYRWIKPEGIRDLNNDRSIDTYNNLEALEALYFGEQISGGVSIVVWNKLYKSKLLKDIRFVDGLSEDIEFTPKVYYAANRLVKYNYNFYNFYFSPDSLSRSVYGLKNTHIADMKKKVVDFFAKNGLKRYEDYTYMLYIGSLYNDYYECRKRRKNKEFAKVYKIREKDLKNNYGKICANPYNSPMYKHILFHISPTLWYIVLHIYRTIKRK